MTEYPLINHFDILAEWLKTYPALIGGFGTDEMQGEIHVIEFDPNAGINTNMLQNVQCVPNTRFGDINGTLITDYDVSYMLFARRYKNDNFWRKEAADFLTHMCQWCEQEYIFGRQPKFGNGDYSRIKITGGSPWNIVEHDNSLMDFMWQLNITYQLVYEE